MDTRDWLLARLLHLRRRLPLATGLVAGGFVARLGLEWTGRPWPWPLVLLLGTLLASAGGLIAWRLCATAVALEGGESGPRSSGPWWPLLLLAVYLVWPQRQPAVATRLLALAGLTVVLNWNRWTAADSSLLSGARIADVLTFSLSLALYVATAAPDLLPADSGEFQIVAPLLGVAHPPGYPLYTLLGRSFTLLIPFGPAAYRLNLLSAFLAAGALTLLGAASRRWAHRLGAPAGAALVGGLMAVLTLGTATTFWAQAGVANVRMPTVFLAALGFYALARYGDEGQADRALWLLALALGLGLGHHPSLAFIAIFFLLYLLLVDPRLSVQPRRWWRPVLVVLITLLPLLYLPLRGAASARLAPPDLDTWGGFVHHVTAQGFEGDMFAYANARDLPQRMALVPTLFRFQFNLTLLAAAALGLLVLAWRNRRLLILLAGGLALHTFVSITYRAPQTVEYLMPAYLPLAILTGLAMAWLLSPLTYRVASYLSPCATLLAAAILLAGLSNGLDHSSSFFALARNRSTRTTVESILGQAPPDALILADWHWATPLWYLQWVEGQRPDVEVRYVYPVPGQEYGDTWRERIESASGERPLLLTHAYDLPGYTLEPLGEGFWIHQRPCTTTSTTLSPLDVLFPEPAAASGVRLLGYSLNRLQARPGRAMELVLAWQAVGALTNSPSFSVQLIGGDERPLAQADRYLGTDYAPGEVRFERLALPFYPDIPPGDYRLTVQVYSVNEGAFETWALQDGATRLDLATLPLRPDFEAPLSLHPLSIPFANGPTLVGVDYDRTLPTALRLYLHWRGPAQGGEQVRVAETTARLPVLPDGAYQTLVLDLPAETDGRLRLTLTDAGGRVKSAAGPWGWSLREVLLPAPAATARFVPLGGEMVLIGVTPEKVVASGDQLTIRLTFLALQPLVSDYGISVRLLDGAGQLRQIHDLQPVLGAIPTLKWIQGTRVVDPHPFTVPHDLRAGPLRATLVVYERFRGALLPLPPLDGRMGVVPLGEWEVVIP